jgi:ubiquinone/menaquinone biosynthesis C-methylase UbiE
LSILKRLIEQAKRPKGIIGSLMLRIMNVAHAGIMKWTLQKMNMEDGTALLDIGCGGGKSIKILSQHIKNGKVYGIDYSAQAVKESIRKNKQDVKDGKVTILKASVTDIPFDNNTFSIITAFQTHYFWPDFEMSVREIYRVLKSNGELFIVAPKYNIDYHMKVYKSNRELEVLLKEVGFTSVQFFENPGRGWLCVKSRK